MQFRDGGTDYLLETVAATRREMVRRLDDPAVRREYTPHFAVAGDFRTAAYWGYLRDWHARESGAGG